MDEKKHYRKYQVQNMLFLAGYRKIGSFSKTKRFGNAYFNGTLGWATGWWICRAMGYEMIGKTLNEVGERLERELEAQKQWEKENPCEAL